MNLNWIITDTTVEFTPVVAGKSKPKMIAPKTQKSRQNAEIPVMIFDQPDSVILNTVWGAIVNDIRTNIQRQTEHVYIPDFSR